MSFSCIVPHINFCSHRPTCLCLQSKTKTKAASDLVMEGEMWTHQTLIPIETVKNSAFTLVFPISFYSSVLKQEFPQSPFEHTFFTLTLLFSIASSFTAAPLQWQQMTNGSLTTTGAVGDRRWTTLKTSLAFLSNDSQPLSLFPSCPFGLELLSLYSAVSNSSASD